MIKAHLEKIKADKKTDEAVKARCDDICVKLDGMNKGEMAAILREFQMKSPLTGNDLTEPIEFNLMFQTTIGPTGLVKGNIVYDMITFKVSFLYSYRVQELAIFPLFSQNFKNDFL